MNPKPLQYNYTFGPDGPMAPVYARAVHPMPGMIAPPIGWIPLVLKLDEELADIFPDYTVFQVKEKFGGLRYYVDRFYPSDPAKDAFLIERANELVRTAEMDSFSICQVCGEPAEVRTDDWLIATLCDAHAHA